jgi:hypothetical protein
MIKRTKVFAQLLACLAVAASVGFTSVATAQQRTFLVFFDYEKTDIGPSGMTVIGTVAETLKWNIKAEKIVLVGHTDTAESGSLSLVRALEVAKALVATGALTGGAEMSIKGVGGSHPLVNTGPDVREPQNRFVSIVLDGGANVAKAPPPPSSPPQAAVSPPPVDGREAVIARIPGDYSCVGINPNGSSYRCNVNIARNGDVYQFRWLIADGTRYNGSGRLRGRTLSVNWGQSAPVIYQVGDDGVLRGTWSNGRGRETLTPDR